MTQALVPAGTRVKPDLCGECGGRLSCANCAPEDIRAQARLALSEVVRGIGGRNSAARVAAAKIVLAKEYLEDVSDEDLLAEVRRRRKAKALPGEKLPGG